MAKEPPASSPPSATPLKRSTPSSQNMRNQKSILGFFQKSSPSTPAASTRNADPASSPAQRASESRPVKREEKSEKKTASKFAQDLTPVPSSDLGMLDEEQEEEEDKKQVWSSDGLC